LHTTTILTLVLAPPLSGKRNEYCACFREKIGAGDLGSSWKERLAGDLIPGGKEFLEKVRKMLKGNRSEQKPLRALERPPTDWDQITTEAVENLWDEPWEEVSQRHGDPGRELAMLIAR
jgi:hypothetical protein